MAKTIPKNFNPAKGIKRTVDIPESLSKAKAKGKNVKTIDPQGEDTHMGQESLVEKMVSLGAKAEQLPADSVDLSPLIDPKTGLLYERPKR